MQGNPSPSSGQRKHGKVPLLAAAETEENSKSALPNPISLLRLANRSSSLSSASSSPPTSSSASSSSSSSSSASASASSLPPPFSQRISISSGQRRQSKPARERRLPKPFSEPAMLSMEESLAMEADAEKGSVASHAACRRCMTDTDVKAVHGLPSQAAPDLLQLFNIFQFNTPERPYARMLVNVTLVGNIQPVRLLVAYDASVQDVIKASLKAYVKEGRLSCNCIKNQTYGLHYSPFCLESIDPTEMLCSLGTRSFFLFPRVNQFIGPTQISKEGKPWWKILSLMLT